MEIWVAEIRIRAKRRLGELTKEIPKTITNKPTETNPSVGERLTKSEQLKAAGISTQDASRCEKLLDIDESEFEDVIIKAKEDKKPITVTDVEKVVNKKQRKKKQLEKESTSDKQVEFIVTNNQDIPDCDAIVTDPPYGILSEDWDDIELESFTRDWLKRANESSADIIISSWSQRYLFDGRIWFDNELTNYHFQQLLIWHYPNNKSPQSRMGFKHTFEPIFFYRRNDSKKEIGVGGGDWGDGLNDFDCHVSAMPQSNFKDENMKQHPAQKSLDVMRWLVNAVTNKGDMVVDLFCGSGTTGIAAKQLDRNFHGIEINPEYIEIAKNRISTYG